MELTDLVGKHLMTGVNQGERPIKSDYAGYENCDTITFELDGVAYQATEDPQDGYRSCMRELDIVPTSAITNRFSPAEVMCVMRKLPYRDEDDILDCYDTSTGKVVLSVGTDDSDNYYPVWVAEFTPENMAINANK